MRYPSLDLRRLQALYEVGRCGSFSEAADALSFTQSAISQQIATLERQTQTKLVHRNPVVLTEAGRALADRAAAAIAQLVAAEAELAAYKGLGGGRLRLSAIASAGSVLVPHALAAFHQRYPGVAVSLEQMETAQSHERIRSGELDLALTLSYTIQSLPHDDLLDHQLLLHERVLVALPASHRLAERSTVKLEELAGDRWIQATNAGLPLELLATTAHAAGFEREVSFEGDDFITVQALVEAGLGVAIVPELALDGRRNIALAELDGEPLERSLFATTLATTLPVPSVTAMLALLGESAAHVTATTPDYVR